MDGFDQMFDRVEAHQSRFNPLMVDYRQSQYPIYDHHYKQGHIPPHHVLPSWYTPPPCDFRYVYGDVGGASISSDTFGPRAQNDKDHEEVKDDNEDDDDDGESDD